MKGNNEMKWCSFFLLLILCACTINPESRNILDISDCEPPCWIGITPGVSSKNEVEFILNNNQSVIKNSIIYDDDLSGFYDSRFLFSVFPTFLKPNRGDVDVEVLIKKGIVEEIVITGKLNLQINEIFKRFGDATLISINKENGDFGGISATAYNEKMGYGIGLGWFNKESNLINPEREISGIGFFNPQIFSELKAAGEVSKSLFKWDGYGNIFNKYPMNNIQ